MLDLSELEQLVMFSRYGTLSKTAEKLHISQPTITRTMQHIEEEFGVVLFERGKNRIALNETGKKAVECAEKLLEEVRSTIQTVQTFDKNMHTIRVESCAPAPLWTLLPELTARYHENMISSRLVAVEEIVRNVKERECDIGILPAPVTKYESFLDDEKGMKSELLDVTYLREVLYVCIPKGHDLARYSELSMAQLNGFNCILRDQIGFWTELCHEKMPASRFLIQTDEFAFEELIRASTLFCFTTNFATDTNHLLKDRKVIPITDPEADVTYHLICRWEKEELLKNYR